MSNVKKAEKDCKKAVLQTHHIANKKDSKALASGPGVEGPTLKKESSTPKNKNNRLKKLNQAQLNHETVHSAKAEIGEVYHPYSLKTAKGRI